MAASKYEQAVTSESEKRFAMTEVACLGGESSLASCAFARPASGMGGGGVACPSGQSAAVLCDDTRSAPGQCTGSVATRDFEKSANLLTRVKFVKA